MPPVATLTKLLHRQKMKQITAKCITVLLQIREVPSSKLDQDTGCQKRNLSCLPKVPPAKCRGPHRVILSALLNKSHVNKQLIILCKGQRKHDVWQPQGIERGQATALGQASHTTNHSPLQKLIFPELRQILRVLRNTKVRYRDHNSMKLAPVLSQINPLHDLVPCFFITQVCHWTVSTDTFRYIRKCIMGSDIVWLRTQVPKFCGNTQSKFALKMKATGFIQSRSAPARLHWEVGLNS